MGKLIGGRSVSSRVNRFFYRLVRGFLFRTECDPIDPKEWLLRRTPSDYYNSSSDVPFTRVAFRPHRYDVDGISLFREMFVSPKDISATGRSAPYTVARIRALSINDAELKINATPDSRQPPGHSSIPKLSIDEMKSNKPQSKEYQFALAKLAVVAYDPIKLRKRRSRRQIKTNSLLVFA